MRILIELETVSISDIEFGHPRSLDEVPVEYFNALKNDININGLLRPIKVHAFVSKTSPNIFSVTHRMLQDGFVRMEVLKALGKTEIECETHFFVADQGLTTGYKQKTLSIEDINYSSDKKQYTDPIPFPEEKDWTGVDGITYGEAKAAYDLVQKEFQDLVDSIKKDGQPRAIECYCRVTENENGQWLYSEVTSQDDRLLVACELAGLSEINCNIRLIDYRESRVLVSKPFRIG